MEQKELAIHVDRVSKVYKLYRRNRDRLIESLGPVSYTHLFFHKKSELLMVYCQF